MSKLSNAFRKASLFLKHDRPAQPAWKPSSTKTRIASGRRAGAHPFLVMVGLKTGSARPATADSLVHDHRFPSSPASPNTVHLSCQGTNEPIPALRRLPYTGATCRALDKRDRLSLLESSQAAAVRTGDLAGPGLRHVAPGAAWLPPSVSLQPLRPARNPKEQFEHPCPLSERIDTSSHSHQAAVNEAKGPAAIARGNSPCTSPSVPYVGKRAR